MTYAYDDENRLVQVEDDESLVAHYYYDPFGQRLWKEVNGAKTYFFYADEGLVAEFDANGAEIQSYGYHPNATWSTAPAFLKRDGAYYFYHNDHLGTPYALSGVNGAVVWSADYQAFGKADVAISTVTNNFRLPGQYYDEETGLHYNRFRHYSPDIGRYLQVDPIGITGGLNIYEYARNNPVSFTDPLGLMVSLTMTYAFGPIGDVVDFIHCDIVIEYCDGRIERFGIGPGVDLDGVRRSSVMVMDAADPFYRFVVIPYPVGRRYGDDWPVGMINKVPVDHCCEKDLAYRNAAMSRALSDGFTKSYAPNNNCCHWAREVIEDAGGYWPLDYDINHGLNPGSGISNLQDIQPGWGGQCRGNSGSAGANHGPRSGWDDPGPTPFPYNNGYCGSQNANPLFCSSNK